MAVAGVGIDIVDVERFAAALARTPGLLVRLLTEAERSLQRPERLAARFAAKEAVAKALGAPGGLHWHDAEVVDTGGGQPALITRGTVAQAALERGIHSWHLSLSHDAGMAVAMVVAEC